MADRDKPRSEDSSDDFLDELSDLLDDGLESDGLDPSEIPAEPVVVPDAELIVEEVVDFAEKVPVDFDLDEMTETVAADQQIANLGDLAPEDEFETDGIQFDEPPRPVARELDDFLMPSADDDLTVAPTAFQQPLEATNDEDQSADLDFEEFDLADSATEPRLFSQSDTVETELNQERPGDFTELNFGEESDFVPLDDDADGVAEEETLTEANLTETVDFREPVVDAPSPPQFVENVQPLDETTQDELDVDDLQDNDLQDNGLQDDDLQDDGTETVAHFPESDLDANLDDEDGYRDDGDLGAVAAVETTEVVDMEEPEAEFLPVEEPVEEMQLEAVADFADETPNAEVLEEIGLDTDPFDAVAFQEKEQPEELVGVGAETTRMPFELETSAESRFIVAPPVPIKRRWTSSLAKALLGLLLAAFALQGGLWWGIGVDPIGLAGRIPSSLSWMIPAGLRPRNVALKPALPPMNDAVNQPKDQGSKPPAEPIPDDIPPAEHTVAAPVQQETEPENDSAESGDDEFVPNPNLALEANDDLNFDAEDSHVSESPSEFESGSALADSNFQPTEDRRPVDSMPLPGMDASTDDSEFSVDTAAGGPVLGTDDAADTGTAPQPLVLDELEGQPASALAGPIDAPSYSRNEVAAAIAAARDADQGLTDARLNRGDDLVNKAEQFYRSFAMLAEMATYVNRDGADQVLDSARSLIGSFEFDDKKQRMIANATRNWMKAQIGSGVFVAANIADVVPKGELFEIRATLLGKEATPLTLLTPIDPTNATSLRFVSGDTILLLGTIIQQPDRNIEGYSGAAQTVIWFTDLAVAVP